MPGVISLTFPGSLKAANEFQEPTFKFNLDHRFSDDILGYVSVTRGFKAGTYNLLPLTLPVTQPETLDSYEAGLKTTLLDHKLLLNGAFFHYNYTNPQVEEVVNHLIFLANAGAAEVNGFDLDGQYVFTPDLSTRFGFAYLDPHYTVFNNAPFYSINPNPPFGTLVTSGNAAGNLLPFASRFAFNAGLNYRVRSSLGQFEFNGNYGFVGSFRITPDNFVRQKSYGLLDASLTYTLPHNDRWSLRVWGKNITGEKYFVDAQEIAGSAGIQYAPGAPALYGATLNYRF